MQLGAVAPVILGLVRLAPRSGYDVKRIVDRSTRFFWAASYGQIYPELRRLEAAGLVEGESQPTGGRRRTVYRITSAGEEIHDEWLRAAGSAYELRDLGLLKLFFGDLLDRPDALRLLREMRAARAEILDRLRIIKADPRRPRREVGELVIDFGVATHEFWVEWLDRAERELAKPPAARDEREATS